ncbi:hypothetical protein L210DRAFT_3504533 [Boletus edulis BED1]|uniref:Uncharacterized protein n=1 Tax=Boletus edulis BED1 TaxID=1328754 RepID=A0AAD4GEJ5_BOLED|nr:hypothetical protein L210DRAFT_3504533 [Boletus edulis BED1]
MSFLSKGEFNSEPEGKEERAEMCQWHELHWSATERGAMEHPEFEADATKENGGGCNEPEDVPILPVERDRESLEGCLHVTEWWSNSRSCHRISEDAAETGSEEVRRWVVKRTGERSENRKNAEQSSHNPGKGWGGIQRAEEILGRRTPWRESASTSAKRKETRESHPGGTCLHPITSIHKENAPELVGSEMDGAVMEQYWRRSGGLEVREMIPEVTSETKVIIGDVEMTLISGLGGRQKMMSGLAFHLQESGKVAARNLIRSTDRIEDIRQEVLNGREGGWSVTEDAQRHEGEVKTTTKSSKSGVPLEVQKSQRRRQWNGKSSKEYKGRNGWRLP